MIDTIKPLGLDFTKSLHGHVRVETRDRWTGKIVDSQEKHNLVTNALQRMILTNAWATIAMGSDWTPLYAKLLGTVLLFDNSLTASADNYKFPSSAKLVGYAGQGSNTTDPIGGSYNGEESVRTSNGFTTVWDFTTSQANGTISALARTSHAFTEFPVCSGNQAYTLDSGAPNGALNNFYSALGYDETNKYLYFARTSAQTLNNITYSVNELFKVPLNFNKIGFNTAMPPASEVTRVKLLSSSDGTTTARYFTYDPFANNFVYATGTTLHIVAMDGTHTTKSATGTSGGLAITENYYWRSTGTTVYRIDKSNTANIQTYTVSYADYIAPLENDVVVTWSTSSYEVSFVYPDGTIKKMTVARNGSLTGQHRPNLGVFHSTQSQSGNTGTQPNWQWLWPSAHYLGTIANLDSPVTKTSSQTMKITYTLTES